MLKRTFRSGLLLLSMLVFILAAFYGKQQYRTIQNPSQPASSKSQSTLGQPDFQHQERKSPLHTAIPQKVYEVLDYVKKYDRAPKGYEGGREFKNRERQLDEKTKAGIRIRYREWDVNPKQQGRNRGRERLVTGDDERAWYTNDHYTSFREVK